MTKVLIIEDEKTTAFIVSKVLQKLGYAVLTCASVEGALELYKSNQVDLVFVDWHLDGASGLDFVRSVRREANSETSPYLVMMTYTQNPDVVHTAFHAGVNDYLPKPIRAADIWARMKTFMLIRPLSSSGKISDQKLVSENALDAIREVGHEISSPLTNASFQVEAMADLWESEKKEEFLASCDQVVGHLARVSSIVNSHKKRLAGETQQKVECDLRVTLSEAIDLLKYRSQRTGAQCFLNIEEGVPEACHIPETEILQVLLNLLNNSYDAIQGQSEPWIRVSLKNGAEAGEILISVEDSGDSTQAHQGLMGSQLQGQSLKKGHLGYGLRLTKAILNDCGTELNLPSSKNTSFSFRLRV